MFLQQSEILYWENNLDKEFRELKQQNKIVIRLELLVKESDTVTLLITAVVFGYLQLSFLFLLSFPTLNQPMHVFCNVLYFIYIYICYLPGGRSVWEKTVPEVLSTARGRRLRTVLKSEAKLFSHTDQPSPVNNIFIFFPAVNWFYRVLMVCLFTQILSLHRLARRLLTICKN